MILDREFPPDIRVENEIQALLGAGYEVHIACYTQKSRPSLEKAGDLTIHRKPISTFIYKSSLASLTLPFYFRFWKKFIDELFVNQKFDILHIHDLPLAGVGIYFGRKYGIKVNVDLHENWPAFLKISRHSNTIAGKILSPVFLWRRYERKCLEEADSIIVVVEEAKERLNALGIQSEKIHVVSNTINVAGLNSSQTSDHKDIILYYAGGINYHRGLQDIIIAMGKSSDKSIKFVILGEGSYRKTLEKLVNKLSLSDRVIFEGYQPFKTVMERMFLSDFAVIPHIKSEHTDSTIPHKLFQYMYAEKPVIASNCLPIKRIIEETGAGLIYRSTEELSEILDKLSSIEYREMSRKGREAVMQKYNWNVDSQVLLNLYKGLQNNKK